MSDKSGFFPAAFAAMASIITNFLGSNEPRRKCLIGTIRRTGRQTFDAIDLSGGRHVFQLAEPFQVFLNEKQIGFSEIADGRRASVRYLKKGKLLFACEIDVFPTLEDIPLNEQPPIGSEQDPGA